MTEGSTNRCDTRSAPSVVWVLLVLLAVYGDQSKIVLSGSTALGLTYSMLVALMVLGYAQSSGRANDQLLWLSRGVALSLAAVVCRAALTFDVPAQRVLVGTAYTVTPILLWLISPRLSQGGVGRAPVYAFQFAMVPTIAVGLYQHFVNPDFMVMRGYSEFDAVVERNMLTVERTFKRLPSLFASADRFASMSGALVILSLAMLNATARRFQRKYTLWQAAMVALGVIGLLVAGARSRILVVGAAVLLMSLVRLTRGFRDRRRGTHLTFLLRKYGVIIGTVAMLGGGAILGQFPVVEMFRESAETGDVEQRVVKAMEYSMMRETTTAMGSGIGSLTQDGTPAEFGIRATWLEMGIVMGSLFLVGQLAILAQFLQRARASMTRLELPSVLAAIYLALTLATGLLTGLKSVLELSTAIMMALMVGIATHGTCAPEVSDPSSVSPDPVSRSLSRARAGVACRRRGVMIGSVDGGQDVGLGGS